MTPTEHEDDCWVWFVSKGKKRLGYLSPVPGGGSETMFQLMCDGFYYGKLWYTYEWRFASNSDPHLEKEAEYFGMCVIAWLDSLPEKLVWSVSIPELGDYFPPKIFPDGEIPQYPSLG